MASAKQRGPEDKGKMRVRFMEVEIEGSNETLLEGIRQITSATGPRVIIKQIGMTPKPPRALTNGSAPNVEEVEEVELEEEEEESDGEEASADSDAPASVPKRQRTGRVSKAPPLSTDLRLDEEPMPLKEFCDGTTITADSSIIDKAIVVATWLKEHRSRNEMTAGDLYTCCKVMDWHPPTDTTSPMRNLKRDDKMDSNERGKFYLTLIGEKHYRDLRKK